VVPRPVSPAPSHASVLAHKTTRHHTALAAEVLESRLGSSNWTGKIESLGIVIVTTMIILTINYVVQDRSLSFIVSLSFN
jgi:hypothetical protein